MSEINKNENLYSGFEIAIIGISGRFPGSKDVREFWENLKNGKESISVFSDQELRESGVHDNDLKNSKYVRSKGIVEGVEFFDPFFFGYTPKEIESMDPQLRIFHECCWEALEDAGYDPYSYDKKIGVFAGAKENIPWKISTLLNYDKLDSMSTIQLSDKDHLATLISYKLNLRGPSLTISTACSTSLVAIHMACRSILGGECNICLAGGVTITHPQKRGYLYKEGLIQSSDGHHRSFDVKASGSVFSNGAGVVVLKNFEDAKADGDNIYAIIKGSAINNDGNRKIGYTAPSVIAQKEVIEEALIMAETESNTIGYIECHGSATPLGDLIEIQALSKVFKNVEKDNIKIGSVKTNVGHLDAASGVAGIIKAALVLHEKVIPPTLNFTQPNSEIDFSATPFKINTELYRWDSTGDYPRRAGVSSFGQGGTNAHFVMEEFLPDPPEFCGKGVYLLLLSAKTNSALSSLRKNLLGYLENNKQISLPDLSFTLKVGRSKFNYRQIFICSNIDDAIKNLKLEEDVKRNLNIIKGDENKKIIFVFSGIGNQYIKMGYEFYEKIKIFREEFNACSLLIEKTSGINVTKILYQEPQREQSNQQLKDIEIAQYVMFALEYSLARMLINLGITPTSMIGYSFGEYVAATIAETISLEDVIYLLHIRAKLIRTTKSGLMISVPLTVAEVNKIIPDSLSIAIDNGESCIVSGRDESICKFENVLRSKKLLSMRIESLYAMHSTEMDSVYQQMKDAIRPIKFKKAVIPYMSNVTGNEISKGDDVPSDYWADHLRKRVEFNLGLKELFKNPAPVFIEVGAGSEIMAIIQRFIQKEKKGSVLNLIKRDGSQESDLKLFLNRLGNLWLAGVDIDWDKYYMDEKRRRISLPTYPFEREKFWKNGQLTGIDEAMLNKIKNNKKKDIANWFYTRSWKKSILNNLKNHRNIENNVLFFLLPEQKNEPTTHRFIEKGYDCTFVYLTNEYAKKSHKEYLIDLKNLDDYVKLFETLEIDLRVPNKIIHLASNFSISGINREELYAKAKESGFDSVFFITKSLLNLSLKHKIDLYFITTNTFSIIGENYICPERALIHGALKVVSQECPFINCYNIDLEENDVNTDAGHLSHSIYTEILFNNEERTVAYRGGYRWVPIYENCQLNSSYSDENTYYRKNGVYLITGGLGQIGLAISEFLIREFDAKVMVVSRSGLPPKENWHEILEKDDKKSDAYQRIKKIIAIESFKSNFFIYNSDVQDIAGMRQVVRSIEKEFGTINGVIHAAGTYQGKSINLISELEIEDCDLQFESKIHGVYVLEDIFKNRNLDFCVLTSSLSPILGGLRYYAYSAANAFMDSFVYEYNRRYKSNWISINWADWQFSENNPNNQIGRTVKHFNINAKEGIETFDCIMRHIIGCQIIVSSGDLNSRIKQWVQFDEINKHKHLDENNQLKPFIRENISAVYKKPETVIECKLIEIWQQIFGVDEIGVLDDFIELGGDSLKAITIINLLHEELKVQITLKDFFTSLHVKGIATHIDSIKEKSYRSINRVEKMEYYPLSSAQQNIFIACQLHQEDIRYNELKGYLIKGNIDKGKVNRLFQVLVDKHELLRASIHIIDNKPVQKIHNIVQFNIDYSENKESELEELIEKFKKPFDLSKAPLLRVKLIKCEENVHLLLVDMPHIITDDASHKLLTDQMIKLYKGHNLNFSNIHYKDFVSWQNSDAMKAKMLKQEKFWLETFKGDIPVFNLNRNENISDKLEEVHEWIVTVDDTSFDRLTAICKSQRATLYNLILSAYNILLYQYTGQRDIVIGSPALGRNHKDLEDVFGVFINMIALRNIIDKNDNIAGFLKKVRNASIEAFENQEYQYTDLLNKLNKQKQIINRNLFGTVLNMLNADGAKEKDDSNEIFQISSFKQKVKTTPFDLLLTVAVNKNNMTLAFRHSNLYSTSMISKMAEHMLEILSYYQKDIETPINEIRLSSDYNEAVIASSRQHGGVGFDL